MTAAGIRQAKAWGDVLLPMGFDRILASDLGRAKQTVALMNRRLNLSVAFDAGLREMSWGQWEGRRLADIQRKAGNAQWRQWENMGWTFRPPGGEDRLTHYDRCHRALAEAAARFPKEKILVVAHGGVLKALSYKLSGNRFRPSEPPFLLPYHLHWLTFGDNGLSIETLNAVSLAGPGGDSEPVTETESA